MSPGGRLRQLVVEEDINGVTIVNFAHKKILDEQNIQQLGEELTSLVDGPRKILLNFQHLEYMSSAAIGKLTLLNKLVVAAKGKLRICSIGPTIFEIFKITRLNKVFDIHKDEQTALDRF